MLALGTKAAVHLLRLRISATIGGKSVAVALGDALGRVSRTA
jgi:hypothetical protein